MKHRAPMCASMILALFAQTAIGAELDQSNGAQEPTVYTAENFVQFAPRTALDMVTRIPGFSIQGDDDGSRGFGAASGNVLINGQRVSGKSNGASAALKRIATANVERIEVRDGTALGIPGLSGQVVNVITRGSEGVSGTWRLKNRFREDLTPTYNDMNLTVSGGSDRLRWTMEADSTPERRGNAGPEQVTDGSGTLIEFRKEEFAGEAERVTLSGSLAWKPSNGAIANLNAKAGVYQPENKEVSKRFPVDGVEGRRLFKGAEDEETSEIGADYEIGLGPGRLKAITLVRREESPITDRVLEARLDGTGLSETVFSQSTDEGEYILRSEYSWVPSAGQDWQISLEGAFNYLEAESALLASTGGGPLVEIPLLNSNSRIEEQRGEFTVTHGRALSKDVSLQVSVGAEMSELSQTGDAQNVRTFTRPKGFASLSWQAQPSLKLVTRLDRQVGQLDFLDFISSVNLHQGGGNEGNTDIVPEQAWKLSLTAEKDFNAWGAATVTMFGSDIEDIVDRIPIGAGDGPGNLDSAWEVGIDADATLKLAKLGLPGAELKVTGKWRDSRVTDPLTGIDRPINGTEIYNLAAELRRDIPLTDWAVGIRFESANTNEIYKINERFQEGHQPAYSYAYVENKNLWGMTGRAFIGNILNQHDWARREVYVPNRLGALSFSEAKTRDYGAILALELTGAF